MYSLLNHTQHNTTLNPHNTTIYYIYTQNSTFTQQYYMKHTSSIKQYSHNNMELHSNILKSTQKLLQNPQNNLSRNEKYRNKTNKHVTSDHINKMIGINKKINYNLTTMHATMHEMH